MTATELVQKAKEARELAYAPYSHFTVGAALLTSDGRVFLGANIENAAYSVTCCAERVALFRAVSEGARDFCAVAVIGGEAGKEPKSACYPCGVCRQAFFEFCDGTLAVYTEDEGVLLETTLAKLLPNAFDKSNLK
jgi:cytidine deaminase